MDFKLHKILDTAIKEDYGDLVESTSMTSEEFSEDGKTIVYKIKLK